jgi:hypothetical protein
MKSVIKGSYKAIVGAGSGARAETYLKVRAGAETKSFGSTILHYCIYQHNPLPAGHEKYCNIFT